ncbi:hypothetical protein BCV69DRAFT_106863 [Microstroma glucosiphilum]|uniref:Uncharacterized protein n=1 Tax=Pseudomicrostroma glucosiphilum TaxID=1684307 RepID=A0A316UIM5_9BASI|nr:hypothetical protein BCV69DRAFT_106863 [Pseudomicrostroma glucosiphilum]PWN23065.1 hypothetical protein BCV69DRAFT_106863 [Pseudomicrostroma glucosiphilum]
MSFTGRLPRLGRHRITVSGEGAQQSGARRGAECMPAVALAFCGAGDVPGGGEPSPVSPVYPFLPQKTHGATKAPDGAGQKRKHSCPAFAPPPCFTRSGHWRTTRLRTSITSRLLPKEGHGHCSAPPPPPIFPTLSDMHTVCKDDRGLPSVLVPSCEQG